MLHLTEYCSWAGHVNTNPMLTIFHSGSLGQTQTACDRVLAGGVNAGGWNRQKPADRGCVYDRSALSLATI